MSTPNSSGLKSKWFAPCRRLGLSRIIKRASVGTPSLTAPEPIREKHNSEQKSTESLKRSVETIKVTKTLETPTIQRTSENNNRAKANNSSGLVETHHQKTVEPPDRKSEKNCDKTTLMKSSCKTNEDNLKSKNKSEPVNKLETRKKDVMKECSVRLNSTDNKLVSDSKPNIPSPKKNVEIKKSRREKRKPVKRLLAESEDFSDDDFNITKSSSSNSQVDEIVSKPKRRRAVLSSSEDEDFVISQKSNKEKVEDNLQLEVQEMKRQTLRLHDLQQAAVYRNLHNVEEFEELTRIWKNKCVDAVRKLHKHLQDHGPVNMSTLLEKLKIPSDFLSYNTVTDVFS